MKCHKEGGPHSVLKNPGDLWADVCWEKEKVFPHLQNPFTSLPHPTQAQKLAEPSEFVELWTEEVKRPWHTATGDRASQTFMITLPSLGTMVTTVLQPLTGSHWAGLMPPEHIGEVSIWKDTVSSRGEKIPHNLVTEWTLDSKIAPQDQEELLQSGKVQGWKTIARQRRDRQVWGHTTWFHCSAPRTMEMVKIHLLTSKTHP